ncbi:MAG: RNA polymerase sigma factor [Myxococcales bacterium]
MRDEWVESLYRLHGPMVFRRARALLGSEDQAWDVVQEVFSRALRSRSEFRHGAAPTTWLYRITTNAAFNKLRDEGRRRGRLAALAASSPPAQRASSGETPELRLLLAEILRRIPAQLCEIAVYYHVDRMNQDEIAIVIGTSRKTVGNRLRQFHTMAQELLGVEKEASA